VIRSFIAIEIPDDVRAALGEVQAQLKRAHLGVPVSWVKVGNVHLTLQFLGYIPDEKVAAVGEALNSVAGKQAGFDLAVTGLGAFPNAHRPRVLWAGCRGEPQLSALASDVQAAMSALGFEPEHREFAAHLTLGRVRWPRPDAALTKVLASLKDCACGTMRVGSVHLFQSQLHPQGSIYAKLSSHELKGV